MSTTHLTAEQRAALQRGREHYEDRMAEEATLAEQRRRFNMTTRKTAQGDRVPKFKDRSGLLDAIEQVTTELEDLYDEAAAMADRNARIDRGGKPDPDRFNVLKGV
jgi:hypothetical protein